MSLRRVARRTWRFFSTFVAESAGFLPPDNFQEDPRPVLAQRTSPTNCSLSLLASVTAHDLGWIGLAGHRAAPGWRARQPEGAGALPRPLLQLVRPARAQAAERRAISPRWTAAIWPATCWPSRRPAASCSTLRSSSQLACRGCATTSACCATRCGPLGISGARTSSAAPTSTMRSAAWKHRCRNRWDPPLGWPADGMSWRRPSASCSTRCRPTPTSARKAADSDLRVWAQALREDFASHARDVALVVERSATHPWRAAPIADAAHALSPGMSYAAACGRRSPAPGPVGPRRLEQGARTASALVDQLEYAGANRARAVRADGLPLSVRSGRKLFSVGYRVDDDKLDDSYYDLLASEARLTSLVAIAGAMCRYRTGFASGRPVRLTADGPSWCPGRVPCSST